MKKLLLLFFILLTAVGIKAQDKLSEGFESGNFPLTGWVSYQASTKSLWSTVTYATEANLKSKTITGYNDGALSCAKVVSGGLNAIGKVNPSSWLISPAVSVADGDCLRFFLGYNCSYNSNALVTDDSKKTKFEVLVSVTTADTLAFTDVIYTEIPAGVKNWSEMSLDLSKYAGKDIYIAFHEYGTPQATPFLTNNLYIDDVKVSTSATSDLFVSESPIMSSGVLTSQPISLKVKNTGKNLNRFTIGYRVDESEPVKETFDTQIGFCEEASVRLSTPAVFPADGKDHVVKVWCEAGASDLNQANDTASVEVSIFENAALPYIMGDNSFTDFTSSYKKSSGRLVLGWTYMDAMKAWVYTSVTNASYLYSNKSYSMKKGKLKIKMFCTSTAENGLMEVFLTKVKGAFGEAIGSKALKTTLNALDQNLYIDVPEDGDYIIAFKPQTTGQVALFGLKICEPYDDVIAEKVVSPDVNSMLAQADVPITVRFRNDGTTPLTDVPVCYQIGEDEKKTGIIASIDPESTIDFTFDDKADFTIEGAKLIKAWSQAPTDGDIHNDSITTTVYSYNPKPFPYTTSFETSEDAALWTSVNADSDDTYWAIENVGASSAIGGTKAVYINYLTASVHNDYFISPAISLTKDALARIAFYYAPLSVYGGSHLKAYLTKSHDPEKILSEGILLLDEELTSKGYHYASAPVSAPETGVYYVAIYNCGGKDEVVIDNFTIDAAPELAVVGLKSSVTGSGYDKVTPNITISVKNCGVTQIKGATVAYTLYKQDGNTLVAVSTNQETYIDAVKPNTVFDYTFKNVEEISEAGTYYYGVVLENAFDTDSKNNTYACNGPVIYPTKNVPYVIDFEDAADRAALNLNGGWKSGAGSTPYEGSALIQHSGAAVEGGDWAYLNRVYLEPGTYDFSFFWKTMTNNTADAQRQNFEVLIGSAANPEAMTTSLYKAENALNADHKATKILVPLTISQAGNYFIGLKCTSTTNLGSLNMDYFRITEPVAGKSLTVGETYKADFAAAETEWYHYYPTRTSSQWTAKEDLDGGTYMTTERKYVSYMGLWTTPGLYESPAFKFAKGDKVTAKFGYSMFSTTSTALDGTSKLKLFMADKDVPESFTTLVAEGDESYMSTDAIMGEAKGAIEIPADGVYYFGFVPESTLSETFNIHSFELTLDGTTSVTDFGKKHSGIIYAHNTLRMPFEYENIQIVNIDGQVIGTFANQSVVDLSSYSKGLYIVRVASHDGITTLKVITE